MLGISFGLLFFLDCIGSLGSLMWRANNQPIGSSHIHFSQMRRTSEKHSRETSRWICRRAFSVVQGTRLLRKRLQLYFLYENLWDSLYTESCKESPSGFWRDLRAIYSMSAETWNAYVIDIRGAHKPTRAENFQQIFVPESEYKLVEG